MVLIVFRINWNCKKTEKIRWLRVNVREKLNELFNLHSIWLINVSNFFESFETRPLASVHHHQSIWKLLELGLQSILAPPYLVNKNQTILVHSYLSWNRNGKPSEFEVKKMCLNYDDLFSKMHLFKRLFLDFELWRLTISMPVEVGKSYLPQKKAI